MIFAAQPGTASAGFSIRVDVNADVSSAPWRLRDGTSTPTIGTISQANAIPRAIVDSFERVQPFTASVGLRTGLTLTAYAGSVIVAQTTARGTLKDTLDARDSLNQQLFTRFSSESGVNVDRELALMIEIQSSYAASAKVIQATRQMFDDLMSIAQ
jgi:flagellar hook-associated protein 1 FlgK